LPTVQALVAKFDRARTGNGQDLAGSIRRLKPFTNPLKNLGMITFETFLLMAAHLAHVRSIFEWNDPSRTGRVTYST